VSYRHRRQPLGCGTVFLLAFFVCLIPASIQTGQWWIGLFVGVALVIGVTRAAARRPTPTHRQPVVGQVVQAPRRVLYRSRCDWCGSPREHGTERCPYCGRSLIAG
jgi:hypothetical protein